MSGTKLPPDVTVERLAQFARLVEWSADAFVMVDRYGTIIHWNHAATRLFGYAREEAVGQPATILAPPDHSHEITDNLGRLRAGEPSPLFNTVRRRKDGMLVPVSVSACAVADADNQPAGAIVIVRDITHQLLAESALNQSEESYRTL